MANGSNDTHQAGHDENDFATQFFRTLASPIKTANHDLKNVVDTSLSQATPLNPKPPHSLFGREEEKKVLLDAFHSNLLSTRPPTLQKNETSFTSSSTKLVIVKGEVGIGKSSLVVRALYDRAVREMDGFFIAYRFNQYQRASHLTEVLDEAFDDFAKQVLERDAGQDMLERIQKDSNDYLLYDKSSFRHFMPSIKHLFEANEDEIGSHHSHSKTGTTTSITDNEEEEEPIPSVRRSAFLASLLKAVSKERPCVLLLDDIHWAHPSLALEVLNDIVPSLVDCQVLVVATMDPTKTTEEDDNWFFQIPTLTEAVLEKHCIHWKTKRIGVHEISLECLSQGATTKMIEAILKSSGTEASCENLGKFLFGVTLGHPLFVEELLRAICKEGLLSFRSHWDRKEYHVDGSKVRETLDCGSLDSIIQHKIERVSEDLSKTLKVAAALGQKVDYYLVSHVLGTNATKTLDEAVACRILESSESDGGYWFPNGKMQQAAYGLIDEEKRKAFHVVIGRQLWKSMTSEEVNSYLPLVLFQINLGIDLLTNQAERFALASLLLKLALKLMRSSSFLAVVYFLEKGVLLLGEEKWNIEHNLTMDTFNTLSETQYLIGNYDRASLLVDEICANADSSEEKLPAQCLHIKILLAQGEERTALEDGLTLLSNLGVHVPKDPNKRQLEKSFEKTQRLLEDVTDEFFLDQPVMTEAIQQLTAMQIMSAIFASASRLVPFLGPMISNKMVELTVKHGSSSMAAFALSIHAMCLCSYLGKPSEGYRFGDLSIRLTKQQKEVEFQARVRILQYGSTHVFTRPPKQILHSLWEAITDAIQQKDIEFATYGANVYSEFSFLCSARPLLEVKNEIEKLDCEISFLKTDMTVIDQFPQLSTVRALLGEDISSTDDTKETDVVPPHLQRWVKSQLALRAYILGEYWNAAKESLAFLEMGNPPFKSPVFYCQCFFAAVALTTIYPSSSKADQRRMMGKIELVLEWLEVFATNNPELCLGKVHLIKAELCVLEDNPTEATSHYTIAIAVATNSGFLLEEAIANERAARCMLRWKKRRWAANGYFDKALEAFKRWGAIAKVKQLEEELQL